MPVPRSVADIGVLKESWNVECKLALGRDGDGALPHDVWETYCAFANTQGGDIFLGLRELEPGSYELAGIPNPDKVVIELMGGLQDNRVVSANLLLPDSVSILIIDTKAIIHITVPRAPIYLRPVHTGNDPLTGSFVRSGDADIRLSADRVKRMQAQVRGQLLARS